jgi:hypothetical protein
VRANRLVGMRRRWFPAKPVDEAFFQDAPFRLAETFDIPRTAAQVWDDLTAERPLPWCKMLREISWTSPRPFGVGTTRQARTLGDATVLNERYFCWEEGRRQSFYVVEASLPLFRRLAEDYLVEPVSDAACRFTWTIAIEPFPLMRLADPANRMLLSTLFSDTRKHYGLR